MPNVRSFVVTSLIALTLSAPIAVAQDKAAKPLPPADTSRGDAMIAAYFKHETQRLDGRVLNNVKSLDEWKARRVELRKQLFEMLGLDPLPKKTDLKATVTGKVEHDDFTVEKLHYQSRPGLYVTGNLYIPRGLTKPAPTILYVCGHGRVKKGDVSYGNKTHYQHHGAWFARNGYVCLTIDTLQLGEIEGIHHGTYRHARWWWNARGYTPAGVEAWNCIRALDYLETRDEVDMDRVGVTGRSGGGAYSWWIASTDERVNVAVPVAGITDLRNHVHDGGFGPKGRFHDGVVEGHCDCMYMVNTYRWDYATVASLVAPRPLLISNTDKDAIFPLDGVVRLHSQVRHIYELYGKGNQLGLHITEGPHKDTQELRIHAFRWFNRWLKKDDALIDTPADKLFEVEQLRVLNEQPADQVNTTIDETFTAKSPSAAVAASPEAWANLSGDWMGKLSTRVFRGWPNDDEAGALNVKRAFQAVEGGVRLTAYDFDSQGPIKLRLYLLHRDGLKDADLTVLNVVDGQRWIQFLSQARAAFAKPLHGEQPTETDAKRWASTRNMLLHHKWVMAYVAPRGVGPTAWDAKPFKQTQHRRRFMMLGQTLDGMRAWDVRRAIQALRATGVFKDAPLWLQSERQMAGVTLYASLFEPDITRLDLHNLPKSHRDGPTFLNVLRFMDTPQAVAMAAARSKVRLYHVKRGDWKYALDTAEQMDWPKDRLQIRSALKREAHDGQWVVPLALRDAPPVHGIKVVKTWGELKRQAPIELGNGVIIRLGLEADRVGPHGGALLYVLVDRFNPPQRWSGKERVGPVLVDVRHGPMQWLADLIHVAIQRDARFNANARLLYVKELAMTDRLPLHVTVRTLNEKQLAVGTIKPIRSDTHGWLTMTQQRRQVAKDKDIDHPIAYLSTRNGRAAAPHWPSIQPIDFEGPDRRGFRKHADNAPLPVMLPDKPSAGWKLATGRDHKGLRWLTITSDEPFFGSLAPMHLLARWWINGVPVKTRPTDLADALQEMAQVELARHLAIQLDFDAKSIGAKKGDRVGVQLMYVPHGWRLVGPDRMQHAMMDVAGDPQPKLTNRVEWVVK